MRKTFLQTIALAAIMCSFGSIDSVKAEECEDYRNKEKECNEKATCRFIRFTAQSGRLGKCLKDICKPYDNKKEECTGSQKENCRWIEKDNFCTIKPSTTKKKGFSGSSDY